ncbi:hypothetical protein [Pseudomonas fluorescens]|uniref:hypothetical protein n=1 Tax=Pseudomonas fluorescens TaxID=294 RepID=UPI001591CE7D|nr:hypothetical protein [Pseudomonas fluorescens]
MHLFPLHQLSAAPARTAGFPSHAEPQETAPRIPAFEVSERRFGENFDGSTHAAVIKMMMMTFGGSPTDVFNEVRPVAGGYAVTMKDEFKIDLAFDELQQASSASRFTGADSAAVRNANFMFAAFVKRKQLTGDYPDFAAALAKTLEGETALRCLQGMGVYGLAQYVPAQQMVGGGVVGVLETHHRGSALVLDGIKHHYADKYRVDRGYGYRLLNFGTDRQARNAVAVSAVPVGVKPADVWSGFYQGDQGNCVTVSAIKAAMMRFGQNPAGIYKHIGATPWGYKVSMRDSVTVSLSHEELEAARRGSNLRGDDQAQLDDANFLYAVSVKRAQLENNDFRGNQSFEVAMQTLNDGEHPGEALRRLGLYGYVRDSNVRELAAGAIGTLADNDHSMGVINGVIDYYGGKYRLKPSQWENSAYQALKLV